MSRDRWKRAALLVLGVVVTLVTGDPYEFADEQDDWPDAARWRP